MSIRERIRGCCRRVNARLDRASINFLRRGIRIEENELPEAILREIRRLRLPLFLGVWLALGAIGLEVFSVTKGWYLLTLNVPDSCDPLEHWLLGYCVALTMLPFCIAIAGPLVIWWAANGGFIRADMDTSCRDAAPELWYFVDEVVVFTITTSICVIGAVLLLWFVRRRLTQLRTLWGSDGPASEAAVQRIIEEAGVDAAPLDTECCICLEGGDEQGRWLRLVCGHHFHDDCLVTWLRQARACPMCRHDLQAAYLGPDRGLRSGRSAESRRGENRVQVEASSPEPEADATDLENPPVTPEQPSPEASIDAAPQASSHAVGLLAADSQQEMISPDATRHPPGIENDTPS